MFKSVWCIDDIKYPKREARKMLTLLRILKNMPATFLVLQNRAGEGKKMSPSLLSKYLDTLVKCEIVKKDRNLYYFNSGCVEGLPERFPKAIHIALMFRLPVICAKKFKGEWRENSFTIAQLMGWEETEKSPI